MRFLHLGHGLTVLFLIARTWADSRIPRGLFARIRRRRRRRVGRRRARLQWRRRRARRRRRRRTQRGQRADGGAARAREAAHRDHPAGAHVPRPHAVLCEQRRRGGGHGGRRAEEAAHTEAAAGAPGRDRGTGRYRGEGETGDFGGFFKKKIGLVSFFLTKKQ